MIPEKDKKVDYSMPQRQAAAGVIIEMIFASKKILQVLWPIIFLLILNLKKFGAIIPLLSLLAILILTIIFGYLNYRHFSFYIDEENEEFILSKGIFNKKRVAIRFARIQQVNINQSFIQRLIDVYELEIETAGTSKNEAKIRAVSKQTAMFIRDKLLSARETNKEHETLPDDFKDAYSETPAVSQIKISFSSLVKIAVTSDYLRSLGLIIAFFITVYSKLKESIFKDTNRESEFVEYLSTLNLSQYILMIIVGLLFLVFVFNLLRFIIVYFNFTVKKHGGSMLFSYGLFNTKNTIIRPSKVQIVRLVTNYFQRKMNLTRMFISQASSDIHQDKKATIQLPGFNLQEGKQIIQFLFDKQPVKGFMIKPTIRRIIANANKFILVPVILALITAWVKNLWMPFFIGLPIYIMLVSFLIYISYLNNRLFVHDDFIIKKSGIWDISTEIMEPFKIQAITTKQFPWHVKSNVGHVTLHTAGGDLIFKFGDFTTINKYANYWLYQVESSDKEWM